MKDTLISIMNQHNVDILDKKAPFISTNSIEEIYHAFFAAQFTDVADLCRAYSALDAWRRSYEAHLSLQLNPFDGADDEEPGFYYLYIQVSDL